jgi:hypothetical protein
MSGMDGAFADALNRKYAVQETNANSERDLREAQATGIAASQSSENAARLAQANLANQNAATTKPLADASIAGTNSLIGLQGRQGALYGAQGQLFGAQARGVNEGFNPAHPFLLANYHTQTNPVNAGGIPTPRAPDSSDDATQDADQDRTSIDVYGAGAQLFSAGTANVQPRGTPMAQQPLPPPGVSPNTPQVADLSGSFPQPGDVASAMHSIVHHAMSALALHAAGGMTSVPTPQAPQVPTGQAPAPGQTVTNGQWGPGQNQTLRERMGYGVKAAGGATNVQNPMSFPEKMMEIDQNYAHAVQGTDNSYNSMHNPNPGAMYGGGAMPPYGNAAAQANMVAKEPVWGDLASRITGVGLIPARGRSAGVEPGNMSGMGSDGYPAANPTPKSGVRPKGYSEGTAKVPGKGNPGVDKVPAILAPGEAVLNQGAANHMGRGAIAALNALGAHAMAAQGTPPSMPPTAHGTPGPMAPPTGGPPMQAKGPPMQAKGPQQTPMAGRGMPGAKGKVAMKGKGR